MDMQPFLIAAHAMPHHDPDCKAEKYVRTILITDHLLLNNLTCCHEYWMAIV